MGTRIAHVVFPDGTQMYTTYSTVTDDCIPNLLPATMDEIDWIRDGSDREDSLQRLNVVCRRHTGCDWGGFVGSEAPLDKNHLPSDTAQVRVIVPGYDEEGWITTASKTAGLIVGPRSAECANREREEEERLLQIADRHYLSMKPRYVIRDRSGRALGETNSRLVAWWTWFRSRKDGATAHDRRSWVEAGHRWLRRGDLPLQSRRD